MKIGLIRQRYVPYGGAERYLQGLVSGLCDAGHEVHIFAHSWDHADAVGRVTLHRVPMWRAFSFLRALSFALRCRPLVRRSRCDVVFSLERTLLQDVYRAGDGCHCEWLRQRRRYQPAIRRAAWWTNPLHPVLLGLERRTFSPAHTQWVIANSERGKQEILRHFSFPPERIRVIYNGVDCGRFQPNLKPKQGPAFVLLFVGTGFERKGLEYAIRAVGQLPDFVVLRVVGKGRTGHYHKLARQLRIENRVQFAGPSDQISAAYSEADLLLLPAIYEPFANVCLEALASGLPVVTSRVNGAAEILQPGRNGAVVEEPADISSLANAVRPFLDFARRDSVAAAARATAEAYPLETNVSRTLVLLEEVAARKRAATALAGTRAR